MDATNALQLSAGEIEGVGKLIFAVPEYMDSLYVARLFAPKAP